MTKVVGGCVALRCDASGGTHLNKWINSKSLWQSSWKSEGILNLWLHLRNIEKGIWDPIKIVNWFNDVCRNVCWNHDILYRGLIFWQKIALRSLLTFGMPQFGEINWKIWLKRKTTWNHGLLLYRGYSTDMTHYFNQRFLQHSKAIYKIPKLGIGNIAQNIGVLTKWGPYLVYLKYYTP